MLIRAGNDLDDAGIVLVDVHPNRLRDQWFGQWSNRAGTVALDGTFLRVVPPPPTTTRVRTRHVPERTLRRMSTLGWTCPDCGRMFGRTSQAHDCAPGLSLEEYFETGPVHERPVFDAVMAHVESLGPVHADIVSVGIFLKNPRKFAELRPMQHWVAVSFGLRRDARHPTITRKVAKYGAKYWHTANIASADQIDDAFRDLLTEAYNG